MRSPCASRKPKEWVARESLTRALEVITYGPAFVRNGRMDVLATNALGTGLLRRGLRRPGAGQPRPVLFPRRAGARMFYPDWEAAADVTVAILRTEAGRDPGTSSCTT